MNYVQVVVASGATKLNEALTYHSEADLEPGQVVRVPVKKRSYNGIVLKVVPEPSFNTKEIDHVVENATVPIELLDLAKRVSAFWGVSLSQAAGLMLPVGVHKKRRAGKAEKPKKTATEGMLPLTKDQARALKTIERCPVNQTIVLQGDTGTGKTRVYIELAKQARENRLGSIVLVPEIGLTSQLVNEFETVFKDVFIQHSKMTERERHLQWQKISEHENPIVVGPRSAVFAPVKKLGLIMVDESHEPSYKQDTSPKYSALRVAKMRALGQYSRLILGSATPSIEDIYIAKSKSLPIIGMRQLAASEKQELDVNIVDSSELDNRGKLITSDLEKAITETLSAGQQVLVFHNRRGSSTSVICENCGEVSMCPNCRIPLVHHHDENSLKCHVCGYSEKTKLHCDNCGEATLKYRGFGTKQIESELKKMFKSARVARFDSDVSKKESLESRYDELKAGDIDIIVGTQMIAKGLDLPKLGLVAVPLADTLLYLPDFSSSERFFQLIYQVTGRVGRHMPGKVIIQTYNPDQPALLAAVNRDYKAFYDLEIEERALTNYPPFSFLLSLVVTRKKSKTAESNAQDLVDKITEKYESVTVLGPAPAFYEQTNQGYRWQVVVKSRDRSKLLEIARDLPSGWQFDIDPINLLT